MLALGDRELVDGKPVVVVWVVEVEHPRRRAGDGTIRSAILNRDSVNDHAVYGAVPFHQRGRIGPGDLAERLV